MTKSKSKKRERVAWLVANKSFQFDEWWNCYVVEVFKTKELAENNLKGRKRYLKVIKVKITEVR